MHDHHTTPVQPGESLGDWITACTDFLPLSRAALHEIGPAAQTLGALYVLTGGERRGQMRESLDTIAQQAVLPRRTVQAHIPKLIKAGWLESLGRELLPRSNHRRRRTVTLKLTRKAAESKEPFWILSRWAANRLSTWSERALFAYLCSAWKLVETIELGLEGCADGREFRKASTITKDTGLTLPSIRAARDKLRRAKLIGAYEGDWSIGEATELAVNTAYLLKRVDVAKPVERKNRARQRKSRRPIGEQSPAQKPAPSPEKTCADPAQKPAPSPEKTCADPAQKPAPSPEKTCAPHGTEPVVQTSGKNLGNKLPEKNSWSEHACRRAADHAHFQVDVLRDSVLAEHCFRAVSYSGSDGAIVWKAACWVNTGAITAAQFASVYNGVRVIEPANAVAYFRAILKDALGEARLAELERRTSLPPGFVAGPQAADDEGTLERSAQPEHISSILIRSMKRANGLAKRNAEQSNNGKAGPA